LNQTHHPIRIDDGPAGAPAPAGPPSFQRLPGFPSPPRTVLRLIAEILEPIREERV